MQQRHILSSLFAAAFVLLTAHSSSAQSISISRTTTSHGRIELQLPSEPGTAPSTCQDASNDNIVWGTTVDDGAASGSACNDSATSDENIVWGTSSDDFDNIVWGTSTGEDNIVWGTAFDADENIVWGTAADENIVWGTSVASDF